MSKPRVGTIDAAEIIDLVVSLAEHPVYSRIFRAAALGLAAVRVQGDESVWRMLHDGGLAMSLTDDPSIRYVHLRT